MTITSLVIACDVRQYASTPNILWPFCINYYAHNFKITCSVHQWIREDVTFPKMYPCGGKVLVIMKSQAF